MQFLSKSQQDRDKLLLNFKLKDTVAKAVLKKNNTVRGISLLNFKTYMAYSNQVCVKLEEGQHIHQWNRRKNQEIDPHKYAQLIFDEGTKSLHRRKMGLFSKWFWRTGHP